RDATVTGFQTCALPILIPAFLKCSVTSVSIKQAGRGIAGDINVRQTSVLEIRGEHTKSVVLPLYLDPHFFRDVGKRPIVVVVIEMIRLAAEAPRAAKYGNAFPETKRICARLGVSRDVEIDVVGHKKIEPPIAV